MENDIEYKNVIICEQNNVRKERELTLEEFEELNQNMSLLKSDMNFIYLAYNLRMACYEFLDFVDSIKPYDKSHPYFAEGNRRMLTILSSFYSFISYWEDRYSELFEPIKKKHYDNHFEYCFLYYLRKVMEHLKLPLALNTVKLEIDNSNQQKSQVSFIVKKDKLFSARQWLNKNFAKELTELDGEFGTEINANKIVNNFLPILEEMSLDLLSIVKEQILYRFQFLSSLTPEHKGLDIISLFIECHGESTNKSPLKIMNLFLEAFTCCFINDLRDTIRIE